MSDDRQTALRSVLDPTPDELRAMLSAVTDFAVGVAEGIPTSRAATLDGAEDGRAPNVLASRVLDEPSNDRRNGRPGDRDDHSIR